jgi:jumonji domain-containing protein 2
MERSSGGGKPEVMVFRPTMDEFRDLPRYIKHMEDLGAHKIGLAKVIPPKEWVPRKAGYDNIDLTIPAPIEQQCIHGTKGTFKVFNVAKKPMTVSDFAAMANSPKYRTPTNRGYEDLERKFWTNLTINRPIYGADVSGTLTDADQDSWNCSNLGTILDRIGPVRIEGVNTAYLYFGMWKALFAWHTEDMDLYSVNYLHFGATKAWYAIPPEHGRRFERLAAGMFPVDAKECPAFLRHKMFLITPRTLREHSIPFCQAWQEKGEFMVTFPFSYHAGYNLGYNCAESTNFASERWIEYGKRCSMCCCNSDMVRISMDNFVLEFQPDRYDLWRAGLDVGPHPEDEFSKLYPHHAAARMAKSRRQSAVILNLRSEDSNTKPQVSRRIPLSKPPVAAVQPPTADSDTDSTSTASSLSDDDADQRLKMAAIGQNSSERSLTANAKRRVMAGSVAAVKGLGNQFHVDGNKKTIAKKPRIQKAKQSSAVACSDKPVGMKSVAGCVADTETAINNGMPLVNLHGDGLKQLSNDDLGNGKIPYVDATDMPQQHQSLGVTCGTGTNVNASSLTLKSTENCCVVMDLESSDSGSQGLEDLVFLSDANVLDSEVIEDSSSKSVAALRKIASKPRPKKEKLASAVKAAGVNIDRRLNTVYSLFQFLAPNFPAEITYNSQQAAQPPHCSICSLFAGNENLSLSAVNPNATASMPIIPEAVFACRADNLQQMEIAGAETELRDPSSPSPLCVCARCNVCVHASCYGEPLLSGTEQLTTWTCDRCFSGCDTDACCLCELRGGALKRTVDDRWAHIVCVLALPGVRFNDRVHRAVTINDTIFDSLKTCVYCHHSGLCVMCASSGCSAVFHPTCGFVAGAKFAVCKTPLGVRVTCPQHQQRRRASHTRSESNLAPVASGDHVIAKHRNGRYYRALVLSATNNVFYKVTFEDGTYSNDMFPDDIVLADGCTVMPPAVGSSVQVRWVDGNLYKAIFRGVDATNTVEVQFEDGSTLSTTRDKVWVESEELPTTVASRMSVATETKYNLFQPTGPSAVIESRTRHVTPKYIRSDDFTVLTGRI